MSNTVNESKKSVFEKFMAFDFTTYIMDEENYVYTSGNNKKKLMLFWHYYFLTVGSHWVDFNVTESDKAYQLPDTNLFKWSYLFYHATVENADDEIPHWLKAMKEVFCIIISLFLEVPRVLTGLLVAAIFTTLQYFLRGISGDFTLENYFMPNAKITAPELIQKYFAEVMIEMGKNTLQIIPEIVVCVAQAISKNQHVHRMLSYF